MKKLVRSVLISIGVLIALCLLGTIARGGKPSAAVAKTEPAPRPPPQPSAAPSPTASRWNDPTFVRFEVDDGWCPSDLWAVLKAVPGNDEFDKHGNEKRRSELTKTVKQATYVAVLDAKEFELLPYDFRTKAFDLKVPSTFRCGIDGVGDTRVSLAPSKVVEDRSLMRPGEENVVGVFEWRSEPFHFPIKMNEADAKGFREGHEASAFKVEVAFKVVGSDEHHRLVRSAELENERDDVGAGSVIKTTVVATRVSVGDRVISDGLAK